LLKAAYRQLRSLGRDALSTSTPTESGSSFLGSSDKNDSVEGESDTSQRNGSTDSGFRIPDLPASTASRWTDKLHHQPSRILATSSEPLHLTLTGLGTPGEILSTCNIPTNELGDMQKRYLKGLLRSNPRSVVWGNRSATVSWTMFVGTSFGQTGNQILRIHFLPSDSEMRHPLLGAYHQRGISLSWISQIWPEGNYPKWMAAAWNGHPNARIGSAARRSFRKMRSRIADESKVISRSDSAVELPGEPLERT
jgi:hypothetical protein